MAGEYIEFVNNSQPALNEDNLNLMQQRIKQDIQGSVSGDTLPVGAIIPFGSDTIPENWLLCNGQAVSRTDYQQLFNTIGTTFGQGDGFTTFNLPNLQGKVVVGKNDNDTDFDTLGETGGEKKHTLTIAEMPNHNHNMPIDSFVNTDSQQNTIKGGHVANSAQGTNYLTRSAGGGQAHNILQPYQVQNYIIKAKQSAGVVATVVDNLNSTSATDALSANQGRVLKDKMEGTVLWSDSTGVSTEGTDITLSESLANFTRLVFYSDEGQNVGEHLTEITGNIHLQQVDQGAINLSIRAIRLTITNNTTLNIYANKTSSYDGTGWSRSGTLLTIKKIVGYKY